jgi:hypothetical protein
MNKSFEAAFSKGLIELERSEIAHADLLTYLLRVFVPYYPGSSFPPAAGYALSHALAAWRQVQEGTLPTLLQGPKLKGEDEGS